MEFGEISDYSDLTAGQYEGYVLKRERHYKWRPYWCVLYGRQLTFYEGREKAQIAGRIELQPGSHCDKEKASVFPSLAELFHREYSNMKKYPLRLKTKKGTHVFTYADVKERSRWQMAINNASQENANNVRLSWIPTPFSMVQATPVGYKMDSLYESHHDDELPVHATLYGKMDTRVLESPSNGSDTNTDGCAASVYTNRNVSKSKAKISTNEADLNTNGRTTNAISKSKSKIKREDTRTLIHDTFETETPFAFVNPYHTNSQELVTSL